MERELVELLMLFLHVVVVSVPLLSRNFFSPLSRFSPVTLAAPRG